MEVSWVEHAHWTEHYNICLWQWLPYLHGVLWTTSITNSPHISWFHSENQKLSITIIIISTVLDANHSILFQFLYIFNQSMPWIHNIILITTTITTNISKHTTLKDLLQLIRASRMVLCGKRDDAWLNLKISPFIRYNIFYAQRILCIISTGKQVTWESRSRKFW